MLKKILTWALVIFVGFWVITDYQGAMSAVHGLIGLLKTGGNDLAGFVNSL